MNTTYSNEKALLGSHFKETIWNKKPAEIKLPNQFQIFSEEILIEALRRYSSIPETLKKNNILAEFVTGVNNVKTELPLNKFALGELDNNLDGYLERIENENGADEWSIAYFGLHGASPEIWDCAREFINNLSGTIGARPGGRVDVDCFIGRYSSTPSGIHTDNAHNFGFTFRSGKTMYTWPKEKAQLCRLKSPDYDIYKKDSYPLRNNTDHLCYFPHDALHVGETKKRVSVNVNVSLWKEEDVSRQNREYITSQLKKEFVSEKKAESLGPISLLEVDRANLTALKNILLSGKLEKQMALTYLLDQTTGGMKVPRPIFENTHFDIQKSIRLRKLGSLQWHITESGKDLLITGNGHCIEASYDAELVMFLERLSSRFENGFAKLNLKKEKGLQHQKYEDLAHLLHQWGVIEEIAENE